jgi:hypothetical protein
MRLDRLLAWTAAAALSRSLSLGQEEPPEEPPEEPSEKFEDRVAPVERHGPAEELERLALKLGLSFAPEGSDAPRPEKSDADASGGGLPIMAGESAHGCGRLDRCATGRSPEVPGGA